MIINKLFSHSEASDGSSNYDESHDHDHDHESDDAIIEIIDPETDEVYEFYLGDEFDYQNELYYVLVTIEDEPVYVIARVVEQDGESYLETLTDEENEELYDVYDKILEEAFEDEE